MISQGDMILALAFVLALLSGQGHSEQVGISVELNKRDDGEVGASLYVANATKQIFLNSSLSLKIDAFIDQSKRLISASGYVKETNRNEAIELTCDANSKDREIQECKLSKEAELSAKDKEIKQLRLQKEKEISAKDEELRELRFQKEREISAKDEDIKELRLQKEKEISAKDEKLKELTLQKEKERDEEIQKWSFLCPNEGEELLSIVSGDDEGYEEIIVRENRTKAADLLIVDGHSYTDFSEDMTKINAVDKQRCNFFVSDDGEIYEGIGWNVYNYYHNGGLGSKSLIIEFMKEDRDSSPSDAALNKFKHLVRTAIFSNVLSPHYSVIPFYLIIDRFNITDKSFERNGMTEWVGYRNNLDFMFPSDEKRAQPIVSKLELCGTEEIDTFIISTPIEYLIVSDLDERCFFSCANYLKTMNKFEYFVEINFFLAEDGRAYEVLGWEGTRNRRLQEKKGAIVDFMGAFHNYAPNKRIFDAFEGLIEEGLRLGKLSPTFKIVPIEAFIHRWRKLGKYLKEEIRKHPRFSETW